MKQLIANKDPSVDQFKAAVFERIDDLVCLVAYILNNNDNR